MFLGVYYTSLDFGGVGAGGDYTLTIIDMARENSKKIEPPKRLRNINKLCYFWSNPK